MPMIRALVDTDNLPPGWTARRRNLFPTDGAYVLEADNATVEELQDLERRYRLLLQAWIEVFGDLPPGLACELEPALAQT